MYLVGIFKYCTDQQKSYVQLLYKLKWLLKILIFIKNHSKCDIQSQITLNFFPRSLSSRFLGVISAFININIDLGISKTRKSLYTDLGLSCMWMLVFLLKEDRCKCEPRTKHATKYICLVSFLHIHTKIYTYKHARS